MALFCTAIAFLLHHLYWERASRIFTVLSKQMKRDWEQLDNQEDFGKKLLVPSFHAHQTYSWDVYGQGPFPLKQIKDKKIQSRTFKETLRKDGVKQAFQNFYRKLESLQDGYIPKEEKEQFREAFTTLYRSKGLDQAITLLREKYHEEKPLQTLYQTMRSANQVRPKSLDLFCTQGVCRGASLWFIYLFLKTKPLFTNRKEHLIAVAKQFNTGIPREGALLQAFADSPELLQIQRTKNEKISLYELDKQKQKARDKIKALPSGIYRVRLLEHSLVYIKENDQNYVWDPNYGLLEGIDIFDLILEKYYQAGHPESKVHFHGYTHHDSRVGF